MFATAGCVHAKSGLRFGRVGHRVVRAGPEIGLSWRFPDGLQCYDEDRVRGASGTVALARWSLSSTAERPESQSCSDAAAGGTCNVVNPPGVSSQPSDSPLPLGRRRKRRYDHFEDMQPVPDAVAILRKLRSVIPDDQDTPPLSALLRALDPTEKSGASASSAATFASARSARLMHRRRLAKLDHAAR